MKDIKKERTQSLLLELLSEALTSLGDSKLNSLSITEVVCSRGKHNAEVYVLIDSADKEEQKKILSSLNKAQSTLREYVLSASGWYRCPKFSFKVDETLGRANTLDRIFEQIRKESK